MLKWRRAHLRTLWRKQDRPTDPFSKDYQPDTEDLSGPQSRIPVIDPDVIGPDDFRGPTVSAAGAPKKPFDLWKSRRDLIDSWLRSFQQSRSDDVDAEIKLVLGDPLPNLAGLSRDLHQSKDRDKAKASRDSIAALYLSPDGFDRLVALRSKQLGAVADPRLKKLTDDEWVELDSILVQSKKLALYPTWLTDEMGVVNFGPEQFWVCISEPKEGDWPAVSPGLTAYQTF